MCTCPSTCLHLLIKWSIWLCYYFYNFFTGIPHILEHCTLCGSSQFPVRDPFFKMINRSLASMNAMTGPDYTLYPFATHNEKDFYNLIKVRLMSLWSIWTKVSLKLLDQNFRFQFSLDLLITFGIVFFDKFAKALCLSMSLMHQKFFLSKNNENNFYPFKRS